MAEYTELIKALRHCMTKEDGITICELCPYYGKGIECENVLHTDSADAIEDLQAKISELGESYSANLVAAQNAQPHWVSVEDELPPMLYQVEGDDFCIDYSLLVLAYREASHDFYLARQMDDGHGSTWGTDCFDELYGVTHWMPLPEPPKEVQDETEIQG